MGANINFLTGEIILDSNNSSGGSGYLPLAGGTMLGSISFDGTSGQYIGKGSIDTERGGNYGISLVCAVGYEFNWQAGWLTTTQQDLFTPRPLYLDSNAGTTLRAWDSITDTGTEVSHIGITFPDGSTQTTATSSQVVLAAPNGTLYEVSVSNEGALITTPVTT